MAMTMPMNMGPMNMAMAPPPPPPPQQLSACVTRILSLSGFPQSLKTRDVQQAFAEYDQDRGGFRIKWVDDTSLLLVFNDATVGTLHHTRHVCLTRCSQEGVFEYAAFSTCGLAQPDLDDQGPNQALRRTRSAKHHPGRATARSCAFYPSIHRLSDVLIGTWSFGFGRIQGPRVACFV